MTQKEAPIQGCHLAVSSSGTGGHQRWWPAADNTNSQCESRCMERSLNCWFTPWIRTGLQQLKHQAASLKGTDYPPYLVQGHKNADYDAHSISHVYCDVWLMHKLNNFLTTSKMRDTTTLLRIDLKSKINYLVYLAKQYSFLKHTLVTI